MTALPRQRIASLRLDEGAVLRWNPTIDHERTVAISDLLAENSFTLISQPDAGPYHLELAIQDLRLNLLVSDLGGALLAELALPLATIRNLVKEYLSVCEAYFAAAEGGRGHQLETVDMGRRGLHNQGADLLLERLAEKVVMDHATARRLFTLIAVLHLKT